MGLILYVYQTSLVGKKPSIDVRSGVVRDTCEDNETFGRMGTAIESLLTVGLRRSSISMCPELAIEVDVTMGGAALLDGI